MPAQRPLPSTAGARRAAAACLLTAACSGGSDSLDRIVERSPDGSRVAIVRLTPCGRDGWCESLWVGPANGEPRRIGSIGQERTDEIAWRPDSRRVAFLVDGYHLRLFDAETGAPAGLVEIVPNDGKPTTRIARGLTFSANGAALTFDDCPRDRSGCKPGMVGIR